MYTFHRYLFVEKFFCLFQTDAHTRTAILTFLAIMAQSDNNGNNTNAVHKNGTAKVPFEMPLARSRNHFLQNSVGRRLIAGPDQYVTPQVRSVRMIFI